MPIRIAILVCVAALCAHGAGNVALYYSFDQPPSERFVSELRTEFTRILEPAGIPVEWRELGLDLAGEFTDIFVIRFHGSCSLGKDAAPDSRLGSDELSLAETQVSDGRVLPFADVRCDRVRRYLSASANFQSEAILGRAVARVAAHEMYHMLSGSAGHRGRGIARAEYSKTDLLAETFDFGPRESALLRMRGGNRYSRD